MDKNVALARALSVGADLRTRDLTKLSIAQIDHLALMNEIERLARELTQEKCINAELAQARKMDGSEHWARISGDWSRRCGEMQAERDRLRTALEQIRDYQVIQGMSPALFAEKVLGSSDSASGDFNG